MQYPKILKLGLTLSAFMLTSCAEQPAHLAMPVPSVQATYQIQLIGEQPLTAGVAEYYSRLAPAFHAHQYFAADRKGVVIQTSFSSNSAKKINTEGWRKVLSADPRVRTEQGAVLLAVGPVYAKQRLFLGTELAQCICMHAETGEVLWVADLDGEVLAAPVIDDKGHVFVHTENAMLYALDPKNGKVLWQAKGSPSSLSFRGAAAPLLYHDKILLGGKDGVVRAFSRADGQLIWERSLKRPRGTSEMDRMNDATVAAVLLEDTLFVSSYSGFVARLSAETGAVIWKVPAEVSVKGLVVDRRAVYALDTADRLLALKVADGSLLWKQANLRYRGLTGPLKVQDLLSLQDGEGYVYLISTQTGALSGIYPLNRLAGGPIVAVESELMITDRSGRLHRLSVKPLNDSTAAGRRTR